MRVFHHGKGCGWVLCCPSLCPGGSCGLACPHGALTSHDVQVDHSWLWTLHLGSTGSWDGRMARVIVIKWAVTNCTLPFVFYFLLTSRHFQG